MFTRGRRLLWVLAAYALIALLHAGAAGPDDWLAGGPLLFRWAYGTGYFLLGVLAYAAVRRERPGLHPAIARALTLLGGVLLAGLDAWLLAPPAGSTRLELWMTAILGLALAAVSARIAPEPVKPVWTGDRSPDGGGGRGAD